MSNEITMRWEEWLDTFTPLPNELCDGASYDGFMFETYGEEVKHVMSVLNIDPARIWTLVDGGESDNPEITSGFHYANRIGYFITDKPCPNDQFITVNDN